RGGCGPRGPGARACRGVHFRAPMAAGTAGAAAGTKRASTRVRGALERCGFPAFVGAAAETAPCGAGAEAPVQCGACLLDVDPAADADAEGELLAVLDCCAPRHRFHVGCIFTWAEKENSCPQCKLRFSRIAVYGRDGALTRVSTVQERDQGDDESSGEEQVCPACGEPGNEDALLLCDGREGRCNAAYHYYCVGLRRVPEGDWLCPACAPAPGAARGRRCRAAPPRAPAADGRGAGGSSPSSPPARPPRAAASPRSAEVAASSRAPPSPPSAASPRSPPAAASLRALSSLSAASPSPPAAAAAFSRALSAPRAAAPGAASGAGGCFRSVKREPV
ncbi:unnamed protein product, partial [Prorocentrum cordatum]